MKILLRFLLILLLVVLSITQGKSSETFYGLYFDSLPFGFLLIACLLSKQTIKDFVNEPSLRAKASYIFMYIAFSFVFATLFLSVKFVFLYFLNFTEKESLNIVLNIGIFYLICKMAIVSIAKKGVNINVKQKSTNGKIVKNLVLVLLICFIALFILLQGLCLVVYSLAEYCFRTIRGDAKQPSFVKNNTEAT